MVHALQEAWRAGRSTVVDIRPLAEDPVVAVRDRRGREEVCGGLAWNSEEGPAGHPEADQALAEVLSDGWFTQEASRTFDWIDTFDTAEELVEFVQEEWPHRLLDEDTLRRLTQAMARAGRGAVPFTRHAIGARLLRKTSPRSPPLPRSRAATDGGV